nr:MAG TPA: hypothetical protein [Caudoviricetes sp.]
MLKTLVLQGFFLYLTQIRPKSFENLSYSIMIFSFCCSS